MTSQTLLIRLLALQNVILRVLFSAKYSCRQWAPYLTYEPDQTHQMDHKEIGGAIIVFSAQRLHTPRRRHG